MRNMSERERERVRERERRGSKSATLNIALASRPHLRSAVRQGIRVFELNSN